MIALRFGLAIVAVILALIVLATPGVAPYWLVVFPGAAIMLCLQAASAMLRWIVEAAQ